MINYNREDVRNGIVIPKGMFETFEIATGGTVSFAREITNYEMGYHQNKDGFKNGKNVKVEYFESKEDYEDYKAGWNDYDAYKKFMGK